MMITIYQCPVYNPGQSKTQQFDISDGNSNDNIILAYRGNVEFHYQLFEDKCNRMFLGIFANKKRGSGQQNGFDFDVVEVLGNSSMKIARQRIAVEASETLTKSVSLDEPTNNKRDAINGQQCMRAMLDLAKKPTVKFFINNNNTNSIFFSDFPASKEILECKSYNNVEKKIKYFLEDVLAPDSITEAAHNRQPTFQHCKDNIFMHYTLQTGNATFLQLQSGTIKTLKVISLIREFKDEVTEDAPSRLVSPTQCHLMKPFAGEYVIDLQYKGENGSHTITR